MIPLKILKYGDTFGELALINDAPRSATVTSIGQSELAVLNRNDYEKIIKKVDAREE